MSEYWQGRPVTDEVYAAAERMRDAIVRARGEEVHWANHLERGDVDEVLTEILGDLDLPTPTFRDE